MMTKKTKKNSEEEVVDLEFSKAVNEEFDNGKGDENE